MAVTRISELQSITVPTVDDLLIINDGVTTTNKITFGDFQSKLTSDLQGDNLVFTASVELAGATTLSGVLSVTGDVTFTGSVDGIDLADLDNVAGTAPTNGYVLTWVASNNRWEPVAAGVEPGVVVDSVNGQIGTVVLNADDIDDSSTTHKFATSVQLGLADSSVQPGDNVSSLTNDSNYLAAGANISELVNDAGYVTSVTSPVDSVNGQTGVVNLDADDIDDTSSTHKFATSVQLGLAETAIQPSDSIGALGDVDLATTVPAEGDYLVYDGSDWVPGFGVTTEWEVTNDGSTSYGFTGIGFDGTEANPDIYVVRGQRYRFKRGNGHPFAIQSDAGTTGTLYNDGVTNNVVQNDTLIWEVRMDTPDNLFYQCRSHGAMVGNIRVLNASNTLNNIADNAQGVVVTGKVAAGDLDISIGGGINAAGTSIDFQNSTISFSGASIGGLQGEISDGVDFHLNQSTATDGQLLAWDASANAGNGDYEWVDPTAQSSSTASTFSWNASIIPDTNAQYDLGNAEYKVRHLFLSDNSIKFESGDLGVAAGNLSWQGEPILPTTIANLLTVLGVESHADNGAAQGAGLIPGDVYYNTTESKLKAVTA